MLHSSEPTIPGQTSVSEHERVLRLREAAKPATELSLLEELFRLLEEKPGWQISFDDLGGVARQIPDLRLPIDFQLHRCAFCKVAKSDPRSLPDCVRNKHAVNWLVLRKREGFAGQCHLGLTDLIEPLVVQGRVLGTFFFGSVVVRGTEAQGRQRIRRYCRRRGLHPNTLLKAFADAPRVAAAEAQEMRERLRWIAALTARLVEAWGFPQGAARRRLSGSIWHEEQEQPAVLRQALAIMHARYAEPLRLRDVARAVHRHPDSLGRLFKQHLGVSFAEHLARVRVQHARRLLKTGRYRVGEVAYRTGFADQAHFGKVFKRLTGMTPRAYADQREA